MTCSLIFIHSRTVFLSRSPSPLPHFFGICLLKNACKQHEVWPNNHTKCLKCIHVVRIIGSRHLKVVSVFFLSSSFILLVRRQTKSNYVWQHAFALFKASHIFVTRAINSCSWRGGSWLMSFLFGRMVDIHKSE